MGSECQRLGYRATTAPPPQASSPSPAPVSGEPPRVGAVALPSESTADLCMCRPAPGSGRTGTKGSEASVVCHAGGRVAGAGSSFSLVRGFPVVLAFSLVWAFEVISAFVVRSAFSLVLAFVVVSKARTGPVSPSI